MQCVCFTIMAVILLASVHEDYALGEKYRLQGGTEVWGRVEVELQGRWYTLCANHFNDAAANVFCRSQGLVQGTVSYGPDDLPQLSGRLDPQYVCHGIESHLSECEHRTLTLANELECTFDAAVYCSGHVRVEYDSNNGDLAMGLVQMYRGHGWRSVCYQQGLTTTEASVLCTKFHPEKQHATWSKGATIGSGDPVSFVSITCPKQESNYSDCDVEDLQTCPTDTFALLVCSKEPFTGLREYAVSLYNGHGSEFSGAVQVVHSSGLYTVCADSWDDKDAQVACWEIGKFPAGKAYTHFASWETKAFGDWATNYQCNGTETHLADCPHVRMEGNGTVCHSGHHAGVVCFNRKELAYYMVGKGDRQWPALVKALVGDAWLPLCDHHWHDEEAHVLCTSTGFSGGRAVHALDTLSHDEAALKKPVGTAWDPHFECSGNELDLNQCPHEGWGQEDCEHAAHVICVKDTDDSAAYRLSSTEVNIVSEDNNEDTKLALGLGFGSLLLFGVLVVLVVLHLRMGVTCPCGSFTAFRHVRFWNQAPPPAPAPPAPAPPAPAQGQENGGDNVAVDADLP